MGFDTESFSFEHRHRKNMFTIFLDVRRIYNKKMCFVMNLYDCLLNLNWQIYFLY